MKTKTQKNWKKTEKINIKTVSGSEKPWSQFEGVPDVYRGQDLRKRKVLRLE